MLKKIQTLVFVLLGFCLAQSFALEADDILGVWVTPPSSEGNAHIEIVKTDGKYVGKIIWLANPLYSKNNPEGEPEGTPLLDKRNPDVAKQSRPLLGLNMLQGFVFKRKRWQGGTIYDPESGKTYKCKITLKSNGELKVRGFIGVAMLGRTSIWTKLPGEE